MFWDTKNWILRPRRFSYGKPANKFSSIWQWFYKVLDFIKTEGSAQDEIVGSEVITQTILNRNGNEIIRLCADAIPIATYGFRFELSQYRGPRAAKRTFQVEHIEPPENVKLRLETVNCPRVNYHNLETDKPHPFDDIFFLSQTTDPDSAVVLKRGFVDGIMYPLHSITNISFDKLTQISGVPSDARTRFIRDRIVEATDEEWVMKKITNYQRSKRSADGEYRCGFHWNEAMIKMIF